MINPTLDRAVENSTGISAETFRKTPLSDSRRLAAELCGEPDYPPPFVRREEVDRQLDDALRRE